MLVGKNILLALNNFIGIIYIYAYHIYHHIYIYTHMYMADEHTRHTHVLKFNFQLFSSIFFLLNKSKLN